MRKPLFVISATALVAAIGLGVPLAWGKPGDIIILRSVSPRTAYRPGTGPVTAKANPGAQTQSALSPMSSLASAPSSVQSLTDQETAAVTTGSPVDPMIAHAGSANFGLASAVTRATTGSAPLGITGSATLQSTISGALGGGSAAAGPSGSQLANQVVGALHGIGLSGR